MYLDSIYILTKHFENNKVEMAFTTKGKLFDYIDLHLLTDKSYVYKIDLTIIHYGKFKFGNSPIEIPGHKILEYRDKPFPTGDKNG